MSLLVLEHAYLAFGPRTILDDVNLRFDAGEKVGLIGPNGSGKSTLLRILVGEQGLDGGAVNRSRGTQVGYLPQDLIENPEGTVLSSVLGAVPGRADLGERLEQAEERLEESEDPEEQMALAGSLSELRDEMDHFERYYGEHQALRILKGLGFGPDDHQRPVAELSGGWKMRAALSGLLFQRPDLLFLDEPTNHLDVPSVIWLDEFLTEYKNAVLLICHDRAFFNRHTNRVLSLEPEGLRFYRGNYDSYLELRGQEEEVLEATARHQDRKIKEMEKFVTRFRAQATKARQAQSKAKQIARMEKELAKPLERRRTLKFTFPPSERTGRDVLKIEGLSKAFGDNQLYSGLTRNLYAGDRVAIIGANGKGKSTLLKLIAGELEADEGTVTAGANVKFGYFAQHHTDQLDTHRTVLEEVWRVAPGESEGRVRGLCGAFLFSGDDVDKAVGVLSGGERARVLLARLLLSPGNLLLLDEPTTHLDMAASESLVDALASYDGTLILVSHNTTLLDRLPHKIWDIKDGGVEEYIGNLSQYMTWSQQQEAAAAEALERANNPARASRKAPAKKAPAKKAPAKKAPAKKAPEKQAPTETQKKKQARKREEARRRNELGKRTKMVRTAIEQVESEIEALETERDELEPRLGDPSLYADKEESRKVVDRHKEVEARLRSLYFTWEEKQVELENIEERYGE